jgi:hypothetical protein
VNPRIAPAAVGLAVLVWQILSMPGATLPADPWAPRAEAEILLREGRWGLTPAEAALWPGLIETPGQYFFHNPATGRFYSKYGVLNTALALPPVALARWVYPGGVPARPLLLILNLYNALATALLAAVLFALARRVATDGLAALWTAAALYSGFLWFYTRAQSAEVWHVLVFTVGVWAFVRARETWARRPSAPVRWVALASASAGALALLRFTYIAWVPWLVACLFLLSRGRDPRRFAAAVAVPLIVAAALWVLTNAVKFGGPFATGYAAWVVDGRPHDRFDVSIFPRAVWGFLFSPQRSLFWHFPLLAAAALGAVEFYRRFRAEALFLAGTAGLFFTVFSLTSNWESHAAYGPRYLLFVLPTLSLPALLAWRRRDPAARWGQAVTGLLLAGSLYLQTEVNAQPFFLPYRLAGPFAQYGDARIDTYFARRPYALIDRDVRRFVEKGAAFPPLEWLKEKRGDAPGGEAAFVAGRLRSLAVRNYYFSPDRPMPPADLPAG